MMFKKRVSSKCVNSVILLREEKPERGLALLVSSASLTSVKPLDLASMRESSSDRIGCRIRRSCALEPAHAD